MATLPPDEPPPPEGEQLWVDRDWWREVLGAEADEPPGRTPADPTAANPSPPGDPAPAAEDVPSADDLLATPASAPPPEPGIHAPPVQAPPVDAGPVHTPLPHDDDLAGPARAPAAPDLLADPDAAAQRAGSAQPLRQAAPGPSVPAAPPPGAPQPAPPARPRRPRRVEPASTSAGASSSSGTPARAAPGAGVPPVARPPAGKPAAVPAPKLARRPVREVVGGRVADVALLLLAVGVMVLVYLALTA